MGSQRRAQLKPLSTAQHHSWYINFLLVLERVTTNTVALNSTRLWSSLTFLTVRDLKRVSECVVLLETQVENPNVWFFWRPRWRIQLCGSSGDPGGESKCVVLQETQVENPNVWFFWRPRWRIRFLAFAASRFALISWLVATSLWPLPLLLYHLFSSFALIFHLEI